MILLLAFFFALGVLLTAFIICSIWDVARGAMSTPTDDPAALEHARRLRRQATGRW